MSQISLDKWLVLSVYLSKNYSWKNVGSYDVTNCWNPFGSLRLVGSENKNASWNVFVRVNCLVCNYPMIISEDLFSSALPHTRRSIPISSWIFPWIECCCKRLVSFGKKLKFLVFNLCKDELISCEQRTRRPRHNEEPSPQVYVTDWPDSVQFTLKI